MTKQEAIENHRKLWNWIADEIEMTQQDKEKGDYFEDWSWADIPANECFCCEYVRITDPRYDCRCCPISWGEDEPRCSGRNVLYSLWHCTSDLDKRVKYARQIAELPEAEIYFEDNGGNEWTLTKLEEGFRTATIYKMIEEGTLKFVRRERK